ncbi:hypothetical protein [Tritonibacter sp. SIMBA_163]|uniref:hypothetical protein n=1 Tax=Tritonibacter sp. SIMBA_163 TaxID=3080868 RepID=UPI003981187F
MTKSLFLSPQMRALQASLKIAKLASGPVCTGIIINTVMALCLFSIRKLRQLRLGGCFQTERLRFILKGRTLQRSDCYFLCDHPLSHDQVYSPEASSHRELGHYRVRPFIGTTARRSFENSEFRPVMG